MLSQKNITSNDSAGFDVGAVIVGGGYAIISVVGTIGNALVLYAVITSKTLHNSSNVFITNLAVTDLITCVVFPFIVVSRLAAYQPYQETMCQFTLSILHTTILVSIFSLTSIALNRLVLILSPLKYYRKVFRRRGFIIWITIIWTIAIFVAAVPPNLFNIGRLGYDQKFKVCRPDNMHEKSDFYDALLIFVGYPIPLLIIVVSYVVIFTKVMMHNRRLKMQAASLTMSSQGSSIPSNASDDTPNSREGDRRRFKLQLRITKNMFYIFFAFILCITPHAICNFTECSLEAYTRLVVSTNSMLNPFIYGFNHPYFREVFRKMFKCG